MGYRTPPRTLEDRVAQLEEYVRRVESKQAGSPVDLRYQLLKRGDLLIAVDKATAERIPMEATDSGKVLTAQPGAVGQPPAAAWTNPDRVRASAYDVGQLLVGTGPGTYVAVSKPDPGQVLTGDAFAPKFMHWE